MEARLTSGCIHTRRFMWIYCGYCPTLLRTSDRPLHPSRVSFHLTSGMENKIWIHAKKQQVKHGQQAIATNASNSATSSPSLTSTQHKGPRSRPISFFRIPDHCWQFSRPQTLPPTRTSAHATSATLLPKAQLYAARALPEIIPLVK